MLSSSILRALIVSGVVASAVAGLYTLGYSHGSKNARVEQLRAAVAATQARMLTDQRLRDATNVEVCLLLGGEKEDCEDAGRPQSDD